jgi:hypothetical protein
MILSGEQCEFKDTNFTISVRLNICINSQNTLKFIFAIFLKMYTLSFQNGCTSLKITDLRFDKNLYFNALSIKFLHLIAHEWQSMLEEDQAVLVRHDYVTT